MSFFYTESEDRYGDKHIYLRVGRIVGAVILALFLLITILIQAGLVEREERYDEA